MQKNTFGSIHQNVAALKRADLHPKSDEKLRIEIHHQKNQNERTGRIGPNLIPNGLNGPRNEVDNTIKIDIG